MEAVKATEQESCPTRLLPDHPSEEDALGGGHELTAQALVDLVQHTSGGKAVALLGDWGSGKSTVVRLFRKAVEQRPDFRVFVFDAWSHEGDPLRRSFLERLAAFLGQIDWLEGKAREEIESQMAELAGRKEETQSQTSQVLTREGAWIGGFFALGVPLGAALLSGHPIHEAPLWFFFGLAAALSPLIPALYFTICNLKTKGRWEFPSLVSQNIHSNTTSTIRTPEPTSVEFEKRFKDMLDKALTDERRLVIVVDNLDRLPADQARSVWAAMRTFFEAREATWSDRLWLIVPFDPSAIPYLLGDTQADTQGMGKAIREIFLAKVFQTRLHVPAPVLSDWKAFFIRLFHEALPRHNDEEFYEVYRVYRVLALRGDRPPVPRELKQFVNLVGSQHRIWQDAIPLPMQALYVLLREDLSENPRQALSRMETEVKRLFPGEEKWKDYLLAQHFNVEPDKALQILFLEEIRKGLEAPGSSALVQAARQIRPEALGALVLEALEEAGDWAERTPELLAKAALAIKEAEGLLPEEDYRRAMSILRTRAASAERWKVWDEEVVQGLVALVASAPVEEERRRLVETILSGVEAPSDDEAIRARAGSLADFLDRVTQELSLRVPQGFRFPVEEPADWILALSALDCRKLHEEVWKVFRATEPSEVLGELSARAGRGAFGMTEALAVRALSYIGLGKGLGWADLVNSLSHLLRVGTQHSEEAVRAAVYALLQLKPVSKEAGNALNSLATNGSLFHHLAYVNDAKTLGTLLLPLLVYNPSGQPQSQVGHASQGAGRYAGFVRNPQGVDLREMVELLAELAEGEGTNFAVPNLVEAAERNPHTRELVASLLYHLEEAYPEVFSPEILLEYGENLSGLLGEEFLETMCRRRLDKIVGVVQAKGFAPDLLPAYRRILRVAGGDSAEALLRFVGEGLKRLQQSDWLRLLKEGSGSDALALLRELGGRGFPVELDHRLADALQQAATALLSGEEEYDPAAIRAYLEFLGADARKNLSTRMALGLAKLLGEHRDGRTEEFLEAVGEVVLEGAEELPVENLEDLVLTWLPNALERLSRVELGWFAELLKRRRALIPDLEGRIRGEAIKRVEEAWQAVKDEGIRGILEGIATLLKGERVDHED